MDFNHLDRSNVDDCHKYILLSSNNYTGNGLTYMYTMKVFSV